MSKFTKFITILLVIYLLIGLLLVIFAGFPFFSIFTWPAPYITGFISGFTAGWNTPTP